MGSLECESRKLSCAATRGASGGDEVGTGAAASADGDIAAGGCGWTRHRQPSLFSSLGLSWVLEEEKVSDSEHFGPG